MVSRNEALPMQLADVRAFCRVVDQGSISAAAEGLGETKGAVSRRIARLEQALGTALLRRGHRVVRPTEAGLSFRAHAGRALELLEDAAHAVGRSRGPVAGRLCVTAPQDLGLHLVRPLLTRFAEKFPAVEVTLLLTESVLDLATQQVDVAFRVALAIAEKPYTADAVGEVELALFAAPAYLAKKPAPLDVAGLSAHRLLFFGGPRGGFPWTIGRTAESAAALHLRPAFYATSAVAVRDAAVAGGGIALLPTFVARDDVRTRRLGRVLADHEIPEKGTIFLVHSPVLPSPQLRAFREFALEELRRDEPPRRRRARG